MVSEGDLDARQLRPGEGNALICFVGSNVISNALASPEIVEAIEGLTPFPQCIRRWTMVTLKEFSIGLAGRVSQTGAEWTAYLANAERAPARKPSRGFTRCRNTCPHSIDLQSRKHSGKCQKKRNLIPA